MSRSNICLIGILLSVLLVTGANSAHLRIGLFEGATGQVRDVTSLCELALGFRPTNVIPVNVWGDAVIDGYVGFNEDTLAMSFYDAQSQEVQPIEDFVFDLLGFQPRLLSVVHRSGEFDELLAWDVDRIVLLDLDDLATQDVTMEFAGAVSVSGLCLDDFSNLDDATLVYDGENWYLGFDPITNLVKDLLGADVVRLNPAHVHGSTGDDAAVFAFETDNSPPVAEFSISPPTGDAATLFQFDASDSWDLEDDTYDLKVRWDFESDGNYDTELSFNKTMTHRYLSPGQKLVTLLVMDTEGATSTGSSSLRVDNTSPNASFTVEPESGTIGTVFAFDASASSDYEDIIEELQVRWDFDSDGEFETEFSGDKTAYHQYDRPRLYTATLQVLDTHGDVGQTTGDVLVQNGAPTPCFTIVPQAGNVLTEFEFDATCSSDVEDDLEALEVRWDWDNDGEFDTDYSLEKVAHHAFVEVGRHTVGLEVRDSGDRRSITIRVLDVNNTPSHAAFLVQPQEGTVRTAFSLNASLSYDLEDPAPQLQVRWDFDSDGDYDTEFTTLKTASKNFNTPGQKTITLQVADTLDARSTTTRTVTVVNTAPTACFQFTPTVGDTNTEFVFDASCSTDWESTTGTLEFRWDFEDDGTFDTPFSSDPKAYHQFGTAGSKTVALEVRDQQGYTDQVRDSIEVAQGNLPPVACFTIEPQSGTTETSFEFDANCSSDPDSADPSQLQVRWDFEGDGVFDTQFSYSKVAYYTYSTAGYKSPVVEVKDPLGATDAATQRIYVEETNVAPVACFTVTPESGNTATEFSFDASCSVDPDGTFSTLQFRWDFNGDGTYDTSYLTSPTISHQFTTPGTKTVVLEVKDPAGDTNTTSREIDIQSENEPPEACFTVTPLTGDTATYFEFDASCSTDPDESNATLQVRWDWENDGAFDTSFTTTKVTTHRFAVPGSKTIRLQVKDSSGATDQTTWTIDVDEGNVPPTACFIVTPETGTTETDFLFDASCSTDPDGSDATLQARWDWDNDGTFDTSYSPILTTSHAFDTPGQPTIVVEILDEGGATGRYAKQITVDSSGNNPPVAYFTATPDTGTQGTVFFLDASGSFDEDETTTSTLQVQWDFDGDGAFDTSYSTVKTTTYSFPQVGTYDIMLRVRDPEGATDTYTRRVYVY